MPVVRPVATVAALLLVTTAAAQDVPTPAGPALAEITIDRDDVDVTTSARVKPGTYRVKDANGDGVLRVRGDGITVDLSGVTLIGGDEGQAADTFDGVGVRVVGSKDVVVRGGAIRGFRVGLAAEQAPGIRVEGLDGSGSRRMRLRSTPQREDESDWLWPHENDDGQWAARYGAAISLLQCSTPTVATCVAHDGQNGLLLSRCDGSTVVENDFSRNSGWGIALWRTNKSGFVRNRCDLCVRGYSDGVYARGQDSAGFLVFEQCSGNVFRGNSATHSGDGFFLYAGNETLRRTGEGGCNDNVVAGNDFSYAVANGIEATFSRGNRFVGNTLYDCDHGIWAGYSYESEFAGNLIAGCANGISIEHGRANRIVGNEIYRCRRGVHLWAHPNRDLDESPFGKKRDAGTSRGNVIEANAINGCEVSLVLDGERDSRASRNVIHLPSDVALEFRGEVRALDVTGNRVDAARAVRAKTTVDVNLGANEWIPSPPVVEGRARVAPSAPASDAGLARTAERGAVVVPGADAPPGRRFMVVGPWGPIDPRAAVLFPEQQAASGAARVDVLLAGLPWRVDSESRKVTGPSFEVVSISDGFDVSPRKGSAPARLLVRAKPGGSTIAPFELRVRVGDGEAIARGTIVSTRWTTRFWTWKKDPRTDRAAFDALVKTAPLVTRETDALELATGGAPADGVPGDRFATVAETTLDLPAGTWRLRVTSDDGVRVLVDGKPVLEEWTWHGPKEDAVDLDLAAGRHTVRVEHFELDGYAALGCSVEPVAPK